MDKAIDVSNYSGKFGPDTAACWRAQGFGHIVCGTQRPETTRAQLQAALAGGMTADAYVYLYWSYDVAQQVRDALQAIDGLAVGHLWLDCEDAVAGNTPEQMVELVTAAVAACGDFPHGIYSGRWWWQPNTGDSQAFASLPLWHAEYSSGPAFLPDFDAFRPYGGWTRPSMWQFQGTTQLCGVGVDLNLRETTDVEAPPPPPLDIAPVDAPAPTASEAPSIDASPPVEPPLPLDDAERQELACLRAEQRFLRSLSQGRYAFQPVDSGGIELRQLSDAGLVSLQPPLILNVD